MNHDEFIAESKRIQAEYIYKRRRDVIVHSAAIGLIIVTAVAAVLLLTGCQMPLRQ